MIARGDSIVSMTYPERQYDGHHRQETVTLVGQPSNVASMVAKQVEHWLQHGGGPLTLIATGPFNVINADDS